MAAIKNVGFGYGEIQYYSKVESVPETTETTGIVTITNPAIAEIPSHFVASFQIKFTAENQTLQISNALHFSLPIPSLDSDVSFLKIESEAARQIAPMLRFLADSVEAQMLEFDEKVKDKKAQTK